MEGSGGGGGKLRTTWKSIRTRLRLLTELSCCGSSWSPRVSDMEEEEAQLQARARLDIDGNEEEEGEEHVMVMGRGGLNLAMALAAERDLRSAGPTAQMKTLVRLFEETDGRDESSTAKGGIGDGGGSFSGLCCVCMERSRGAALIPCGHTYCRACSREIWLNRRQCPLCNRSIREILHIF